MKHEVCVLCENADGLCYSDNYNVPTIVPITNAKLLTWHSVKDDAPPTDEEVLVCFYNEDSGEYGSCVVAYYTNDDETLEEFEHPVWWTTDRNYIVEDADKWAYIEKPEVPNV